MPILAAGTVAPPPPPPPPPGGGGGGGGAVGPSLPPVLSEGSAVAQWASPNGTVLLLTTDAPLTGGIVTLPGVSGIGAVPRSVTRKPLATGGAAGRWSHAEERLITWPLDMSRPGDPAGFVADWRALVKAFTATSPPAGAPTAGVLRITRPDGTWREVSAVYLDGLEGDEPQGMGYDSNQAVVQLAAFDPWWYGPTETSVPFNYTLGRSYVGSTGGTSGTDPYETVTPSQATGAQTLVVEGDVAAIPKWTLIGPANSITVAIAGASFTYNALLGTGETIIVDVAGPTVQTVAGANVIGNLTWPASKLFTLPPGPQSVTITIVGGAVGSGVRLDYRPRFEVA